MKNIQVLIDYSDHATHLWQSTLQIAADLKAGIHATHIFHPDYLDIVKELASLEGPDGDDQYENFVWLHKKIEEERMDKFLTAATPVAYQDIPVTRKIIHGFPVVELFKMQEEDIFDLVIIGLNREGNIESLLTDDLQTIIQHCSSPLLIAPDLSLPLLMQRLLLVTNEEQDPMNSIRYFLPWINRPMSKLRHYHLVRNRQNILSPDLAKELADDPELWRAIRSDKLEVIGHPIKPWNLAQELENLITLSQTDLLAIVLGTGSEEESMTRFVQSLLNDRLHKPVLILQNDWLDKSRGASQKPVRKSIPQP